MTEQLVYDVILRPVLTERSTILKDESNQYVFEVASAANKAQIKHAVETLFKVHVNRVRTMVMPGKFRRMGRAGGWRADWKKAVVTLAPQEKIDLTEKAG